MSRNQGEEYQPPAPTPTVRYGSLELMPAWGEGATGGLVGVRVQARGAVPWHCEWDVGGQEAWLGVDAGLC